LFDSHVALDKLAHAQEQFVRSRHGEPIADNVVALAQKR
jgi:hypothetical protein